MPDRDHSTVTDPASGSSLTRLDLQAFEALAESMVDAGKWARVERRQDRRFDLFSIHYPNSNGAVLSVGRRLDGRYVVLDHAQGSLRFGRSFAEALDHLRP